MDWWPLSLKMANIDEYPDDDGMVMLWIVEIFITISA